MKKKKERKDKLRLKFKFARFQVSADNRAMSQKEVVMRPFSAVAVSVFTILFSPTGTSLARQVVVDDDRVQCRNADFSSITAAIAAAAPGERIKVCPGTYEHTVVHKTVQLHGPQAGVQPKDCFEESGDDPAREAIVAGFELLAPGIVLDGFKVKASPTGNGIDTTAAASGYDVRFNVIEANTFAGIHVGSNGAELTRIRHNCVRRNDAGILSFIQAQNVRIEHNFLTGSNNIGIALAGAIFTGAPTSDIAILENELRRDGLVFIARPFAARWRITEASLPEGLLALLCGPGVETST